MIFILNNESRSFTKSVWRKTRPFVIVNEEDRDTDNSENVETLLGRIHIQDVAEFVMMLFCKTCNTV